MMDLDGSWEIGLAEIQYPTRTVGITSKKVVNADYDNRVQYEYLTQKYDLRTWSLLSTSHTRRYTVRVTRCHSQD
jgi:hypothetical protein